MKNALIIDSKDNVATVLDDISLGDEVGARLGKKTRSLKVVEMIPFGFKVALVDIPKGGTVLKYGEAIGRASQPIKKGQLVHIHNIEGARGRGDLVMELKKK
jgi:altronate dehydratase small subunit